VGGQGESDRVVVRCDEMIDGDAVGEGAAEFDFRRSFRNEFGLVRDEGLIPIAVA